MIRTPFLRIRVAGLSLSSTGPFLWGCADANSTEWPGEARAAGVSWLLLASREMRFSGILDLTGLIGVSRAKTCAARPLRPR